MYKCEWFIQDAYIIQPKANNQTAYILHNKIAIKFTNVCGK